MVSGVMVEYVEVENSPQATMIIWDKDNPNIKYEVGIMKAVFEATLRPGFTAGTLKFTTTWANSGSEIKEFTS